MKKMIIVFFMLVMISASIPLGLLISKTIEQNHIYEIYRTSIVLAEDVILDDKNTIDQFGETVILTKGMRGRVSDKIDHYSDQNGYENITVDFQLDDTKTLRALIAIENSNEIWDYPTIGIDKFESSQKIITEYQQSRNKYYSRVQNSRTVSVMISVAVSLVLCGSVWLVYKNNTKA